MEHFSNPDWNKMERSIGFPTAARYTNCVERSRFFRFRNKIGERFRIILEQQLRTFQKHAGALSGIVLETFR